MSIPNHDLPVGHLSCCQICGSSKLDLVIDLGHQAPCDSLLRPHQLKEEEKTYPLRFLRCLDCGLAQIDYVVAPDVLFYPEYPYRSGITPTLVKNLMGTGQKIVDRFQLKEGSLAIDIGSNDGTLLKGFQSKGMKVLGIEATNIAKIAREGGVDTIQSFFSEKLANEIVRDRGQAAVITAANVFAHIPNLGEVLRGVKTLLKEGGVFVTESHYLLDLLETAQYDSIYHEHLKYYSLKPIMQLMQYYGFQVIDAERIPNYGGSIRVYAAKGGQHQVSANLKELLNLEDRAGLYGKDAYDRFTQKVVNSKLELQSLLLRLKSEKKRVVGIGCPGRSSTLLNYCHVDTDLMPYIAEQSTCLKLGMFLPGMHIPIVDEKRMFEENPEYAVMLSWHYAEPIVAKLREKGLKSKIILPLPEVKVI